MRASRRGWRRSWSATLVLVGAAMDRSHHLLVFPSWPRCHSEDPRLGFCGHLVSYLRLRAVVHHAALGEGHELDRALQVASCHQGDTLTPAASAGALHPAAAPLRPTRTNP